jgi:hypothetical protein
MSGNYPVCSLCSSELAFTACLCFRSLKLIGKNCLSDHLSSKLTSHPFITISLALKIQSGRASIDSCLSYSSKLARSEFKGRYIDILEPHSLDLRAYDVFKKQLKHIEIPFKIKVPKTLELPHNIILLSEIYSATDLTLLNLKSKRYTKICYAATNYKVYLFYIPDYIYAARRMPIGVILPFERLNLHTFKWERLPDITFFEDYVYPIQIKDKIYLFHGSDSKIQVLNTACFEVSTIEIDNIDKDRSRGIAAIINSKIYLITYYYIQVYDLKLNKLEDIKNYTHLANMTDCNIVIQNSSLFLYSKSMGYLELDTLSLHSSHKPRHMAHFLKNSNRYIYYPLYRCSWISRFDLKHETVCIMDFSKFLRRLYLECSVCILPSGHLFIVNLTDCQILNPSSLEITKLPDLPIVRYFPGLAYCNNHVYAFGHGDYAFKFSLEDKSWTQINSMHEERNKAACVAVGHNIFIFCGYRNSFEVYDTETDEYTLYSYEFKHKHAVAREINGQIYTINGSTVMVSKDLKIIQEGKDPEYLDDTYSSGNVVDYQGYAHFKNDGSGRVEFMNLSNMARGVSCFKVDNRHIQDL